MLQLRATTRETFTRVRKIQGKGYQTMGGTCSTSAVVEKDDPMDRTRHPAEWSNKYSQGVAWDESTKAQPHEEA